MTVILTGCPNRCALPRLSLLLTPRHQDQSAGALVHFPGMPQLTFTGARPTKHLRATD